MEKRRTKPFHNRVGKRGTPSSLRRANHLWNIGKANHLSEIVNPAGVAIDASGQRPEIQRSARIASPGGSMENFSRIARITCELSAFVNPETSALGSSQGLE